MTATQNTATNILNIDMSAHEDDIPAVVGGWDREGYALLDFNCPACNDTITVHYLDTEGTVTCDCGHGALHFD